MARVARGTEDRVRAATQAESGFSSIFIGPTASVQTYFPRPAPTPTNPSPTPSRVRPPVGRTESGRTLRPARVLALGGDTMPRRAAIFARRDRRTPGRARCGRAQLQ